MWILYFDNIAVKYLTVSTVKGRQIMSKVTVRKAALLTGKSRETINNATKDGTLSYSHNSRNHKVIDIAELERVYPLVNKLSDIEKKETVKSGQVASETDSQEWRSRYIEEKSRAEAAEEKIELIEKHARSERQLLEDQVDNLKDSLKMAQEGHNRATILLEDKSKEGGNDSKWKDTLSKIEERIANQEKAAKEKAAKETEEKNEFQKQLKEKEKLLKEQQEALELEKHKSFIHKILGK